MSHLILRFVLYKNESLEYIQQQKAKKLFIIINFKKNKKVLTGFDSGDIIQKSKDRGINQIEVLFYISKTVLTKNSTDDKLRKSKKGPVVQRLTCLPVTQEIAGSIPVWTAIFNGPLVKRFNTHAFHACIHGFESRTGHHY